MSQVILCDHSDCQSLEPPCHFFNHSSKSVVERWEESVNSLKKSMGSVLLPQYIEPLHEWYPSFAPEPCYTSKYLCSVRLSQQASQNIVCNSIYLEEFFGGLKVLNCGQEAERGLHKTLLDRILDWDVKSHKQKQGIAC